MKCALCKGVTKDFYSGEQKYHGEIKLKSYVQCLVCELIYLKPQFHLLPELEKTRYKSHQNNIKDLAYQNFLNQLWKPFKKYITTLEQGLDFGSGPEKALSFTANKEGFCLSCYDPFFGPFKIESQFYDYITCTEVVEHFCNPFESWKKLKELLNKSGHLGIMTKFYDDKVDFKNWNYRKDETHVSFYTHRTVEWLAQEFNWKVLELSHSICIFKQSCAD